MKAAPVLFASAILATAAGALTTVLMRPLPAAAPERALAAPDALAPLRAEVAGLASQVEELTARLELFAARSEAPAPARALELDVEGAVRRYLEQQSGGPALVAAPAASEASVQDFLRELANPELEYDARQAVWARARAAGKLDDLVATFERRAEEQSSDAGTQLAAGNAYLQKLFEVNDGPERGLWAMRADGAFDRALALDPEHWEARFTKAVSLSFWPPIFGKQAEAVRHFEILVEQQSRQPLEAHFAETYELLGNLYQQMGEGAKARETWQTGLALFPSSASLHQKLSN